VVTYFKCVTCKARLYSAARADSLLRDTCPDCGELLQPVGDLAEIVGYRSIKWVADPANPVEPRAGAAVVSNALTRVLASRRSRSAQAALAAERWLDDGGSFNAPAAASAATMLTPPGGTP
jgi:hypothetical protein